MERLIFPTLFFIFHIGCQFLGDSSEKGTPLPIPNRVVKLLSTDGTPLAGESRTSPRQWYSISEKPFIEGLFSFFLIFLYTGRNPFLFFYESSRSEKVAVRGGVWRALSRYRLFGVSSLQAT